MSSKILVRVGSIYYDEFVPKKPQESVSVRVNDAGALIVSDVVYSPYDVFDVVRRIYAPGTWQEVFVS